MLRKKKKVGLSNKRLKPITLQKQKSGTDLLSTQSSVRSSNNPAAAGGIASRRFGGNGAYQFGGKKNDNRLIADDDQTNDMISVGGGSGYDDATSDIGGIRRIDGDSEYQDDQSMLSINRYDESDAGTVVNGGDSDTSMAMTEVRKG